MHLNVLKDDDERLLLTLDPSALVRALSKRCNQLMDGRGNTATDIHAMRGRYMLALSNIRKNATEAVTDAKSMRNLACDADSEGFANVCPRAYRYASMDFSPEIGFVKAVAKVNAIALRVAVHRMVQNFSVNGIVGHDANPAIDCLAHCFMMGAFACALSSAFARNPRFPQYPQYPWHPEFPWVPRYSQYPCIPQYPLVTVSTDSLESKESKEVQEPQDPKEPQEPQEPSGRCSAPIASHGSRCSAARRDNSLPARVGPGCETGRRRYARRNNRHLCLSSVQHCSMDSAPGAFTLLSST